MMQKFLFFSTLVIAAPITTATLLVAVSNQSSSMLIPSRAFFLYSSSSLSLSPVVIFVVGSVLNARDERHRSISELHTSKKVRSRQITMQLCKVTYCNGIVMCNIFTVGLRYIVCYILSTITPTP